MRIATSAKFACEGNNPSRENLMGGLLALNIDKEINSHNQVIYQVSGT